MVMDTGKIMVMDTATLADPEFPSCNGGCHELEELGKVILEDDARRVRVVPDEIRRHPVERAVHQRRAAPEPAGRGEQVECVWCENSFCENASCSCHPRQVKPSPNSASPPLPQ